MAGTIVVGVDGSDPGRSALRWAIEEAKARKAAAVAHEAAGLDVEGRLVEGNAADALADAGREADLLVVGTKGHGALAGALLGSVSQHLAHHPPCPLVL